MTFPSLYLLQKWVHISAYLCQIWFSNNLTLQHACKGPWVDNGSLIADYWCSKSSIDRYISLWTSDVRRNWKGGGGVGWLFLLIQFRSNLKPIDKYMPYIDSFQISKKWLPGCFFEWSDFEWKTSPFHAPKSLGNIANLPDHSLLKFERSPSVDKSWTICFEHILFLCFYQIVTRLFITVSILPKDFGLFSKIS